MAISILLFEDNDLLRESIVSMLALDERYQACQAFPHVLNAHRQVDESQPDIVLMDIDMPGMTGIEAVTKIRENGNTIPIIMLTVFDDNEHVFEAIRAGASGYLLKKHISTKLFESIAEALDGGAPMSPSIARMVIASMQVPIVNSYQLTSREKEILSSLAKGNSYKLIAAELNISIDTVRSHIKNIYGKLQVHTQTEAVSKAIHEKLV
jgi:DNA-binding NarL/FixJ family response regulator